MKKCRGCQTIFSEFATKCSNCGCILFDEGHPVFGFDTPETLRESVSKYRRTALSEFKGSEVKATAIVALDEIKKAVEEIPPETIDKYAEAIVDTVSAYSEIIIASMPIIDAFYKAGIRIKESIDKIKSSTP